MASVEEDEQSVVVHQRLQQRIEERVGAGVGGGVATAGRSGALAAGGGGGGPGPLSYGTSGRSWAGYQAAMAACGDAVKPVAMILMIIGAGGAFKRPASSFHCCTAAASRRS